MKKITKINNCRLCDSTKLKNILDFGSVPLGNDLALNLKSHILVRYTNYNLINVEFALSANTRFIQKTFCNKLYLFNGYRNKSFNILLNMLIDY